MSALLEVSGISKSFDGFKAINNLSFSINAAELRAVIGPHGAGKTTFMDIVTGKTTPDEGEVRFGDTGRSLLKMNEAQIARAGIGRKFQRPTVFEDQTVADNLTMALKADRNPFAVLSWRPSRRSQARVLALADEVGLSAQLSRRAGELSHGQKQWLEISMVILQDPKLFLVDEPAAGMTDEETERTGELLKELSRERAIIVIEHDMTFVRQLESVVTVFHEGKMLVEGPMEEVQQYPRVIECYLGSAVPLSERCVA